MPGRLGRRKRTASPRSASPVRSADWCCSTRRNRIIRPAKLAGDISVKRQADEIARAFGGAPGLIELAGQAPGVESAAAECLWLKQHEPYHFQRAASLLTAQDFIAYWLTGERATEAGSASGTGLLDIRTRKWSAELLDFIDPRLGSLLPPIGASDQPRGLLRPALAREWGVSEMVQVGAGSASPMLAALAAGCVANGTVAVELGAAGVIVGVGRLAGGRLSREKSPPLCNATGSWLGLATTTNAAVAPEVLRRHYGWTAEQFEAMVASVSPGADGLLAAALFHRRIDPAPARMAPACCTASRRKISPPPTWPAPRRRAWRSASAMP